MAKIGVISFEVIGRSTEFPLDMLRYDCAVPADGESAAQISASFSDKYFKSDRKHDDGFYHVKLWSRREEWRTWNPTTGRWNSFGWAVVEESIQRTA